MIYNDYDVLEIRSRISCLKNILNFAIIVFSCLSIAYLMYWGMLVNDDALYETTKDVFLPIASLFFSNETDFIMFRNTSFCFAGAILPCLFIQYILDKIEEEAKRWQIIKGQIKQGKIAEQAKKEQAFQYDIIKNYSICLSIDYNGKHEIVKENKFVLNKIIFKKIASYLMKLEDRAKISISDVLIFNSSDFSKYDLIYETIISSLAKFKKNIKQNHNINLIPSMTTDAYSNEAMLNNIRRSHFQIQSFNHKNRALSSAMFAKKYKHLNQKKYAGIPIGEYAYFMDNKTKTYELNVIHKNLEAKLSEM